MRQGEGIGLSSHWGGLGGGLGGWKLTPATSAMLLALILLGATLAIGTRGGEDASNNQSDNQVIANELANAIHTNVAQANAAAATANVAGSNVAAGNQVTGNEAAANAAAGAR
jgi:hypothetical protein